MYSKHKNFHSKKRKEKKMSTNSTHKQGTKKENAKMKWIVHIITQCSNPSWYKFYQKKNSMNIIENTSTKMMMMIEDQEWKNKIKSRRKKIYDKNE